jgi:hypothetical protein
MRDSISLQERLDRLDERIGLFEEGDVPLCSKTTKREPGIARWISRRCSARR